MSTRIQIKRGTTTPSGLTTGEFAYNVTNSTLYIGNTADQKWIGGEVTGGVDMGAGSAASQNRVPTQNSVYQYARNNFVHRLNGITGGITLNAGTNITITSSVVGGITIAATNDGVGALTGAANIWTATQYFAAGFSAASGVTFTGTVAANGGLTASTLDVTGLAKFNGNVTVGDNAADVLTVTSGATFGITDHSGVARFASTVTTTGVLTANGGITASAIDVTGLAKFNGNVTVGDAASDVLTVTSGATFGITDHSGVARFAAGVTFSSTTDHAGVARFAAGITSSTLDVTGLAKFNGNVTVGDAASDVLTVTSGSTFNGRADFAGLVEFASGVTFDSIVVSGHAGGVTYPTTAIPAGTSIGTGISFAALSNAAFNGNVIIGPSGGQIVGGLTQAVLLVRSGTTFERPVRISTPTGSGTPFTVTGLSSLDAVIVDKGLTVSGAISPSGGINGATFNSTVDVTGVARFNGGATATTIDVVNAARFNGGATASTLDVTNAARFNGGATASALNVTGVSRLNGGVTASTLDVSGTSRFAGTASFSDSVGLSAGIIRVNTIQGSASQNITIDTPLSASAPIGSGIRLKSDDSIGGIYFSTLRTTVLSAGQTLDLPNDSGTLALTKGTVWRLNGITGGITLNQGTNITITSSVAGGITIAASGGGGALTADANIWTATQYFNAGFSAAAGVTFTGTVSANGGLTASTLDVTGLAKFNGNVTIGDNAADVLTVTSGVTLSGRVDVGGVLDVVGGVTFESTSDHAGAARFASTITATGALTANGGITASAVDVTGLAKFNGNVTVGDNAADVLTVTSGATFGITDHSGVARFAAGVTFASTVNAAGVVRLNAGVTASAIDVTGLAKFNGNVTVGDNAADVLTVTSGSTFGITDHSGAARFASTITATGVLTANGGVTASTIDVTGLAKFNGNVTVGDNAADILTVTSGATFGITDHSGVARFAAGVTASRIDVINDLKVVGGTEINGHVTINRGLTIGGGGGVLNPLGGISGVTFTQTTDTTGVARFNGGATASTLDVTNAARFNGGATASTLDVTNAARFNGGATASALNVTGVSRLNGGVTASTLDVSGTSRFAGTASFPATVGLSAGVAQVTTIQSNNIEQVKVGIPVGVLIAGTTQAGLQLLSDDGVGGNYSTTFQTATLSANRTINLPDDSGTAALTKGTVWRLNGITGGITLNQGANITITSSVAGGITIASTASGGGGGALTADANIWTATQYFNAGFSAASGVTFTGTVAANGGLTASTLDVSGNTRITGSITATQGFTFGSGTTFLAFYPDTAANNGGVYQRQGIFQLGGSSFNDIGSASFIINPNTETHGLYGNFRITTDQTYQAAQNTLSLNISPSHTGRPLRVVQGATTIAGIEPSGFLIGAGLNPAITVTGLGGLTIGGSPIGFSNLGLRLSHTNSMAGAFSSVDTFAADLGGTPTRLDFNNLTIVGGSGVAIGSGALNARTSGYTLTATDNGKVVTFNSASALVCGVDTAAGATGFSCTVIQLGTGGVRFASSGVTLNSYSGLTLAGQHAAASLVCYQTNVFNVSGNLTP